MANNVKFTEKFAGKNFRILLWFLGVK